MTEERKTSEGMEPITASEPQQPDSNAHDSEQADAAAACDAAAKVLALLSELEFRASDTQSELSRDGGTTFHSVAAADALEQLGVELTRLQDFLDVPMIAEALKEANGREMVMVEGKLHNSYCEAVKWIAELLQIRVAVVLCSYEVRPVAQGDMGRSPANRERAAFIEHWDGVSSAIVRSGRSEYYIENLEAQINCERAKLQRKQTGAPDSPNDAAKVEPDRIRSLRTNKKEAQMLWLAEAMLLVQGHPDWSDAEIADRVHRNPSTLSRNEHYKAAANRARNAKADRTKGYLTIDSESRLRDIEAVSPPVANTGDKRDRGQPIPGSKYYREYCAECREPITVPKDKIGMKPLCEHCEGLLRNSLCNDR